MRCEELLRALNDYADGDPRAGLRRTLQRHFDECKGCQIVIDNIRQTITLCRAGSSTPLPAELHATICAIMKRRWNAKHPLPRQSR